MVQWLRVRFAKQGTPVWSLVWEHPPCCGASKPVNLSYWAWALSPRATATEACGPRACAPQEKPLQRAVCRGNEDYPHSPQQNNKINQSFLFFFLGKKKMWYIYAMEYYSAIKNKIIPFAATWMNPEIITMSEVSQKKKDNYHMLSLIYGI